MPFIRYARDKRGYETTYVMHVYHAGTAPQRTRILYLYRSPSSLKIGRPALDSEASEALEHTHPDLSFDWDALMRDPGAVRPEPREREPWLRSTRRPPRGRGGAEPSRGGRPTPPRDTGRGAARDQTPPAPAVMDDQSVLGRALGAGEAGRLRARYRGMLERIVRRSRTPEERDRLTERTSRLNPDDWGDEAAAREGARTVEAEWAAITAELPHRRRGRRGGRRRGGRDAESSPSRAQSGDPSGIMAEHGDPNDPNDKPREVGVGWTDDRVDRPGDGGGVEPQLGDSAPDGATDPDVPGDS